MDKNTQHWTVFNKHWAAEHKSLASTCLLPKYRCFCCIANNSHTALPSRPRGLREEAHTMGSIYMSENCTELKKPALTGASVRDPGQLREQRSRISLSYTRACYSHVLHIQCTNLTLPLFFLTGYCFWDNKLKNLKSWRIKFLHGLRNSGLRCGLETGGEMCRWMSGKTHFVRVEPLENQSSVAFCSGAQSLH